MRRDILIGLSGRGDWKAPSPQNGKARRWRRALELELEADTKVSKLNLQGKLNQPSVTVGANDLAEAAVSHSLLATAYGSIVRVIE
jgi:hypothetical protein